MGYNIVADFFNVIDLSLFNTAAVLLVICFIIWEIPRSIKIMSEEYTRGLYPEGGRVIDFALLAVGIATVLFMMLDGNGSDVVSFLKKPGIVSFFLIIMAVIPLIILLGFLKRAAERVEGQDSVTVFLVHGFLDLMHTIFYIALTILVIPSLGYLIIG